MGCLVHGCFNASILRPKFVPVETWRDFGPRVGTDLEFEVTALDADAVGVLLIRGRLDKTRQVVLWWLCLYFVRLEHKMQLSQHIGQMADAGILNYYIIRIIIFHFHYFTSL